MGTSGDEKVCVLGMGFVGLTLAATLAETGVEVYGIDVLTSVIESLNQKKVYFHEPGLQELVEIHAGRRLKFFCGDIPDRSCNVYVLCVGTPIDSLTVRPRLDQIQNATSSVVPVLKKKDAVVLRSTVPVGTSRALVMRKLEVETKLQAGRDFLFGFVPERTIEGNALHEIRTVPQIIGALDASSVDRIVSLFSRFNPQPYVLPDMEHAELCKLIDNTYRDVRFAYANQMAMICESLSLDFNLIREACNFEYPRNDVPEASPGVGGPCLTKDPFILIDICRQRQVNTALIEAARQTNTAIVSALAKKVVDRLSAIGKNPETAKVFIMGFAFKGSPETSDTRASTTLDLVNHLKPSCRRLYGFDSVTDPDEFETFGVIRCGIEEGFKDADVVVLMTDHLSHRDLPLARLAAKGNRPLILIDCWGIYRTSDAVTNDDIIYSTVGKY